MLFAPTLADRAILPTAWGGRYFFNRIGQWLPSALKAARIAALAAMNRAMPNPLMPNDPDRFRLWREVQDMRVRTTLGGIFYLIAWLLIPEGD